jgi:hypothetical protein
MTGLIGEFRVYAKAPVNRSLQIVSKLKFKPCASRKLLASLMFLSTGSGFVQMGHSFGVIQSTDKLLSYSFYGRVLVK